MRKAYLILICSACNKTQLIDVSHLLKASILKLETYTVV